MREGIDYIIYIHSFYEIDTFEDFFNNANSIVFPNYTQGSFQSNLKLLMDFSIDDGKTTNYDYVIEHYNLEEKDKSWQDKANAKDLSIITRLFVGTKLYIPIDRVNLSVASIIGETNYGFATYDNLLVAHQIATYDNLLVAHQISMSQNPGFKKSTKYPFAKSIYQKINHNLSVWLIKKADPFNDDANSPLDYQIYDISKNIIGISTGVTSAGGNFSIELSPITLGEASYSKKDLSTLVRNKLFFHNLISENDFVFIRFETLELEEEDRKLGVERPSNSELPFKIYDMIGLVDTVSENITSSDITVEIKGRDLIKLLIEDHNYFFPLLFAGSLESSFNSQLKTERFFKRLYTTGKSENFFIYSLRSIQMTLLFIKSQLANLGLVPENSTLFDAYGDRREFIYDVTEGIKTEPANGIWQIIELIVDNNVSDRYIADPSISTPDGSLLGQIKKICQEPFVEFMTDTYGDKFRLIARKPPFDRSSIKTHLNNPGMIIDIEEEDIISMDLSFDNEVYSWYHIKPEGAFLGTKDRIAIAYLPIIYFPEYADIWGSKKCEVISNYLSYKAFLGKGGTENFQAVKKQIIKDLIYLIEINAHKPFTRKGRITINGDRRIKRGHFVRVKSTEEIFYVDSVANSYRISGEVIDRTTTLEVSRGMIEKYILGEANISDNYRNTSEYSRSWKEGQQGESSRESFSETPSYFNIIDLKYIEEALVKQYTGDNAVTFTKLNIESKAGVNVKIFNFFLNRKQLFI